MKPGDLICLKAFYQTSELSDRAVGLVISICSRNVLILFSNPFASESLQSHTRGILMMFRVLRGNVNSKK